MYYIPLFLISFNGGFTYDCKQFYSIEKIITHHHATIIEQLYCNAEFIKFQLFRLQYFQHEPV